MSACATGCWRNTNDGNWLCCECWELWAESGERKRFYGAVSETQEDVAMMDFCNRVRAERNNRGHHEP